MDLDEVKKGFIKRKLQSARKYLSSKWVLIKQFSSRYKFQLALGILMGVSVAIMLIYFAFNKQADFINELGNKDKPFYIRNIAVVLAAIATAIFTWWKNTISHKTTEIQESIRQDELFAKAVDLLKRENDLITRKAGVHILKDLAVTSQKHTQKCLDMLCSLNEVWMPKFLEEYPEFFQYNKDFPNIKNIEKMKLVELANKGDAEHFVCSNNDTKDFTDDIILSQLGLQVIAEIMRHVGDEIEFKGQFNLQHKYLCGANLIDMNFEKFRNKMRNINLNSAILVGSNMRAANMSFANLEFAQLIEVDIRGAKLYRAKICSAILDNANLKSSLLFKADLKSASLNNVDLSEASLIMANCEAASLRNVNLYKSNLRSANMQRTEFSEVSAQYANLTNVDFQYADVSATNFQQANIKGANFENAVLTEADFRNTKFDSTTKLGDMKKLAIFTDEDYNNRFPDGERE